MKIIAICIAFLAGVTTIQAQDKKYPTPDLDNIPYYYDETKNALTDLERVSFSVQARAKGAWGTETVIILPKRTSPVRLKKNALQFIIHFENGKADPYSLCDLNPCTINEKKGQREYQVKKTGAGHSERENTTLPVNYKKVGDGLYLITVTGDISMPEVFFSVTPTKQIYAFGVDN